MYNELLRVEIPDSVTYLGIAAFKANLLTSVRIGAGVSDIKWAAFSYNNLTRVEIPSTVTKIDARAFTQQSAQPKTLEAVLQSTDFSVAQSGRDSIWYAQLMLADSENRAGLKSNVGFEGCRFDADGAPASYCPVGGHLINPAQLTQVFTDERDATLHKTITVTGQVPDGTPLYNYYMTKGPSLPEVNNSSKVSASEQAMVDAALGLYFRAGGTYLFPPIAIAGYTGPAPKQITLSQGDNAVTFTYQSEGQGGTGAGNGSQSVAETSTLSKQLAATGSDVPRLLILLVIIVASGASICSFVTHRSMRGA